MNEEQPRIAEKPPWESHEFRVKTLDSTAAGANGARLGFSCRNCGRKFAQTPATRRTWAVNDAGLALDEASDVRRQVLRLREMRWREHHRNHADEFLAQRLGDLEAMDVAPVTEAWTAGLVGGGQPQPSNQDEHDVAAVEHRLDVLFPVPAQDDAVDVHERVDAESCPQALVQIRRPPLRGVVTAIRDEHASQDLIPSPDQGIAPRIPGSKILTVARFGATSNEKFRDGWRSAQSSSQPMSTTMGTTVRYW